MKARDLSFRFMGWVLWIFVSILVINSGLFCSELSKWRNNMKLTSMAFENGGMIPVKYTCKGEDISPDIKWENAPAGTKSFALICEDPDAPGGVWDHWILYNIPATVHELKEGYSKVPEIPGGSRQGKNSWGKTSYGGPCPPSGTHRYFFKLYAISSMLNLKGGATKSEVLQAMENHVLAKVELMGTFKK